MSNDDENVPLDQAGTSHDNDAPSTKKRKKAPIIVGVIVVVFAVAGIGGFVWHEQPSFCNAICHSPMDPYVEGYFDEENKLLSSQHRTAEVACLDCHEPSIGEQVTEAVSWVSGNFQIEAETHMLLKREGIGDKEFCTQAGCHVFDDVVAATKNYGGDPLVNPHASPHTGETVSKDCESCHSVHRESVLSCSSCHPFDVPDGWDMA